MIRLHRTENVRAILALDAKIFPTDDPVDVWDKRAVWWIAPGAAYCGIRPTAREGLAFLLRAGVVEAYRGQGLQRRMIRTRLRWARTAGFVEVCTYTIPTNPWSSNNLIACGFRLYDPPHRWAGEDTNYWVRKVA